MKDREMLELAAKADGIAGYRYSDGFGCMAHWNESDGGWFDACCLWNPLTDDGDALRLAVSLGLIVGVDSEEFQTTVDYTSNYEDRYVIEGHGLDAAAATRRAITRAAAQIGKEME